MKTSNKLLNTELNEKEKKGKIPFMKRITVIFIVVSILFNSVFAEEKVANTESQMQTFTQNRDDFSVNQKNIIYGDDSYFFVRRIDYKCNKDYYVTSFYIPGESGSIQWFDSKKQLITSELTAGNLPMNSNLYIQTEEYSFLLGQAYNYKDMGKGTRTSIEKDRAPLNIKKEGDKWLITYTYKQNEAHHGILWGAGSKDQLIDFSNESLVKIWAGYDLCNNARFCEDGYYYKSPSVYSPTGPDAFWRIPSMYLINAFVKTGGSLASEVISNAMLVIASDNLNEQGFFPTLPQNDWLKKDYDISSGYFDTRFNADTGETYLLAYREFNNPIFREIYIKMADYYIYHALSNHYTIRSPGLKKGWLVQDFAHPQAIDNHVALNHQLQAIHWFYLLYETEQDNQYLYIANLMLQGIKNTKELWVMSNNNLEYAYMPNGTMGLVDYPYLTYNDLFNVQLDLQRIKGERDVDLDYLMAHKKKWMDENGITNYKK
ncbi:MAG: hypothetical protein CVV02_11405 [Firmicutes bacterium HGW-Firmicutes-7]|nr:MAG: hypothetical protein CVV02_11405 [Firmicutes bacterium HGW-Firmicutes-7]